MNLIEATKYNKALRVTMKELDMVDDGIRSLGLYTKRLIYAGNAPRSYLDCHSEIAMDMVGLRDINKIKI